MKANLGFIKITDNRLQTWYLLCNKKRYSVMSDKKIGRLIVLCMKTFSKETTVVHSLHWLHAVFNMHFWHPSTLQPSPLLETPKILFLAWSVCQQILLHHWLISSHVGNVVDGWHERVYFGIKTMKTAAMLF